jgi:SAM-dependent methyltransferase
MIQKVFHALMKRWGNSSLKRFVWNSEYRIGKWNYLRAKPTRPIADRDIVLPILEIYSKDGDILDLGCGNGTTGFEIACTSYRQYVGVDISAVAVGEAIVSAQRDPTRAGKNRYAADDISTFIPDQRFSVVLFRECIYYFSRSTIIRILSRYSSFLTSNGVFIVRLHDREKYKGIVALIERNYEVIERRSPAQNRAIVMVFSPRRA